MTGSKPKGQGCTNAQKGELAVEDLRFLRIGFYLAPVVGTELAEREILLAALPQQPVPDDCAFALIGSDA